MSQSVHIVGGGLGGLTAAVILARGGSRVHVYERSAQLGGRARSQAVPGAVLNLGPHALYRKGAAARILAELGVRFEGGLVTSKGAIGLLNGRTGTLPLNFTTLLSTGLFSPLDKLTAMRAMSRLGFAKAEQWKGRSVSDWIDTITSNKKVQALLHATVRISTYSNAPDIADAGAAISQMQLAMGGVLYLDGGWQTLVDALHTLALDAGVEIHTATPISSLAALAPGEVLLAVPPGPAQKLLGKDFDLTPVRAACLELVLSKLARPDVPLALGLDVPTYASLHSAYAKLSDSGRHLVCAARYLAPDEDGSVPLVRTSLESLVDLQQPDWRKHVVHERFLPQMTVSGALATTRGRPAGEHVVQGRRVQLVGDWVGEHGMLADAAVHTAQAAAERLLAPGIRVRAA